MSDGLSGPALSFSQALVAMDARQAGQAGGWTRLAGAGSVVATRRKRRLLLRYDRELVLQGEYWRLITAHVVHLTAWHMSAERRGVALIAGLFGHDYSGCGWLLIALLSALAIDVAFVFWEPQITWYVGLSGFCMARWRLAAASSVAVTSD